MSGDTDVNIMAVSAVCLSLYMYCMAEGDITNMGLGDIAMDSVAMVCRGKDIVQMFNCN